MNCALLISCERLKDHAARVKDRLFDIKPLHSAIEEDRLCVQKHDVEDREPKIICWLGS
jgi:hypothetical protein